MTIIEPISKSLGYQWWTVWAWDLPEDCGMKLGPLTVTRQEMDGAPWIYVSFLGWMIWDSLNGIENRRIAELEAATARIQELISYSRSRERRPT